MTDNAITTHDDANSYASQFVKMIGFDHEGAAGSTHFSFGVAQTTQADSQNSSTSALVNDGLSGGSSGSGSGDTGGNTSDAGNALTTSDHASNYTSQWAKIFSFTHDGAAGSTGLSFGASNTVHSDSQSSATSALFGDGVSGSGTSGHTNGGSTDTGTGTGSSDTGTGGSETGGSSGGNIFATSDHAITFDQELVKSLNFAHDGAAGSTEFGFATLQSTHWDSQQSDTSSLFDDGLFNSLSHAGSGSALIG